MQTTNCAMARHMVLTAALVIAHVCRTCGDTDGRDGAPLWIEVLSPRDGEVLYHGDETTKIVYRTSPLAAGALVRLTINGKEAFINTATEMSVNVPGLVVGRHRIAITIVDAAGVTLREAGVELEMRAGFSWVSKHVAILHEQGEGLACSATDVCSFLIDARGVGSSPASGHFFRVRLVGPAIVMGSVHEVNGTSGVYKAEYRAVDAGVYNMSVVLLHASNSGIADPGAGVARQFLNQHIQGSPLEVRVTSTAHVALGAQSSSITWGIVEGETVRCNPRMKPWPLCAGMRRFSRTSGHGVPRGPPWAEGRWVHRDVCLWNSAACEGVASNRIDQLDDPPFADDPWIWVPHGCVLRPYDATEAFACLSQAWWSRNRKHVQQGIVKRGSQASGRDTRGPARRGSSWWKEGLQGVWAREGSRPDHDNHSSEPPPSPLSTSPPPLAASPGGSEEEPREAPAALYFSGTSLVRTMFYDIVCLLDDACNATKEHEDLSYSSGGRDGARVGFHWFARFADHTPFEQPPLGPVDDRTGRLVFNHTLVALLDAISTEAPGADSVIVLGSQIFDILKAPLADYERNMRLLIDALAQVPGTVLWRTGDALHDDILDQGWDFSSRPGRYMNDPRMQEANRIAVEIMREAGIGIVDVHALTHGRQDRSHDGTHYWQQKLFRETAGKIRRGNGVSFTASQLLLNWLCNP